MRHCLLFVTAFLLFAPTLIEAQGRAGAGMSMFAARPAMAAPRVVSHVPAASVTAHILSGPGARVVTRAGTVRVRMPNGTVRIVRRTTNHSSPLFASGAVDFGSDVSAVPGLGFDFPHFVATHPNFRQNRRQIGGFFPFFDGGFIIPTAPVVEEVAPAETAEDAGAEAVEEAPRRTHVTVVEPQPTSAAPEPLRDVEEYVFVKRDGTVFFAVAYSWENGTLRYITNQGLRGTVMRDALDLSATQQFNEQRGLNFRLPA